MDERCKTEGCIAMCVCSGSETSYNDNSCKMFKMLLQDAKSDFYDNLCKDIGSIDC